MAQQPPQPNKAAHNTLQQIHQLGASAASLFSRLYQHVATDDAEHTQNSQMIQQVAETETRYKLAQQVAAQRGANVAWMQHILGRVNEGVLLLNSADTIIYANPAARRLLGSNLDDFYRSLSGTIALPSQAVTTDDLTPMGSVETIEVNGKTLNVQVVAITDASQEDASKVILLRERTQADLSTRIRESFLSHISHELVTPITSTTYAKEFLLNAPADQPANRRMLEKVGRNIDVLARLVDDMLEMAIINDEGFQIERVPLPLDTLLHELAESFLPEIEDAKLEILLMLRDYDDLQQFMGDPKYLVMALAHLMRNAIIYNEPGQQIIVTAGVDRRDTQYIFIAITDTGVGISEKDMPHVFDLYYRGEPRTRAGKRLDPRGLGQGLYITRKITQAHAGYMTATSKVGAGSRFTLVLPRFANAAVQR